MCDINLSCFTKLFSESDRDAIVELSRNISLGSIGLAFAAGGFYFSGVMYTHVHGILQLLCSCHGLPLVLKSTTYNNSACNCNGHAIANDSAIHEVGS